MPTPTLTLCARFFAVTSAYTVADALVGDSFIADQMIHQQSIELPIDADDEVIAGWLLTGDFKGLSVIGQPTLTGDEGAWLFLADGDDEIRYQVTLTWLQ